MQNGVLAIGIGTSMAVLVLLALRSRRRADGSTQLGLGVFIGSVAAVVSLIVGTDLVPDNVETGLLTAAVLVAGAVLTLVVLTRR